MQQSREWKVLCGTFQFSVLHMSFNNILNFLKGSLSKTQLGAYGKTLNLGWTKEEH